jgi:hypothetical protein
LYQLPSLRHFTVTQVQLRQLLERSSSYTAACTLTTCASRRTGVLLLLLLLLLSLIDCRHMVYGVVAEQQLLQGWQPSQRQQCCAA